MKKEKSKEMEETELIKERRASSAADGERRVKKAAALEQAEFLAEVDEKKKSGRGRPTEYTAMHGILAEKFALLGATDMEIAEQLGISERTLNTWKRRHPEFLQSIKRAKEKADADVVQALYRRAIGYEHTEWHLTNYRGKTSVMPTPKQYPPDTAAGVFWLKNRQPRRWRDRREVAFSSAMIRSMSEDDIEALFNRMKNFVAKRGKPTNRAARKRLPSQMGVGKPALPRLPRARVVRADKTPTTGVRSTSRGRQGRSREGLVRR